MGRQKKRRKKRRKRKRRQKGGGLGGDFLGGLVGFGGHILKKKIGSGLKKGDRLLTIGLKALKQANALKQTLKSF